MSAVLLTSGTSWAVPSNFKNDGGANAQRYSAGSGGQGGGSDTTDGGAGGAGGGYGINYFTANPNSYVSYSIGIGGSGGYNHSMGSAGGISSFNGVNSISHNGGYPGTGFGGGGGGGGAGGPNSIGGNGGNSTSWSTGGSGGTSGGGYGGYGGSGGGISSGQPGSAYGGGGGGGAGQGYGPSGGAGAQGAILVSYNTVVAPTISSTSPTSYRGNTTNLVYIYGSSFTTAYAVYIGGVALTKGSTWGIANDSQINIYTPIVGNGWASTKTITVYNQVGNSSISITCYPANVSISSISPTTVDEQTPVQVTISGTSFTTASGVYLYYGGIWNSIAFTIVNDTTIHFTPPVITDQASVIYPLQVNNQMGGSNDVNLTYIPNLATITSLSPAATVYDIDGELWTIHGTNFNTASIVQINGSIFPGGNIRPAFTVVNSTTITFNVPIVTPSVAITSCGVYVMNGSGNWSSPFTMTYYPNPPTISSFTPAQGPQNGGTSVVITGNYFNTATAVTFSGVAATSFHVDSDTQITAVTPSQVGNNYTGVINIVTASGNVSSATNWVWAGGDFAVEFMFY